MTRIGLSLCHLLAICACGESSQSALRLTIPTSPCSDAVAGRTFEATVVCDDAPLAPAHFSELVVNDSVTLSVRACGEATMRVVIAQNNGDGSITAFLSGEQRVNLAAGDVGVAIALLDSGEVDISAEKGGCDATLTPVLSRPSTEASLDGAATSLVLTVGDYDARCTFADGFVSSGVFTVRTCQRASFVFPDGIQDTLVTDVAATRVQPTKAAFAWTRVRATALVDVFVGTSDDLSTAERVASDLDVDAFTATDLASDRTYWLWIAAHDSTDLDTIGPVVFTTELPAVTATTLEPTYATGTTTISFTISFNDAVEDVLGYGNVFVTDTPAPWNSPHPPNEPPHQMPITVEMIDAQTYRVVATELTSGTAYILFVGGSIRAGDAKLSAHLQNFAIEPAAQ